MPFLAQVAAYHYLCYGREMNLSWEWDMSHWLNNASKGALKTVGGGDSNLI